MSRTILNFFIDILAGFLFLGMMATGYILRFPLPPGTNKLYTLWGLGRHQWGEIHFWISLGLLFVIFTHVAMHWSWIVSVVHKRFRGKVATEGSVAKSGGIVFVCIVVIFTLFAVVADKSIHKISDPLCKTCPSDSGSSEASGAVSNEAHQEVTWKDVSPVFHAHCVSCHGPVKQYANFRADKYEDFFTDKTHAPLIHPGDIDQSPLLEIVTGKRKDIPAYERHVLPKDKIQMLTRWITSGAKR
jgi:hypothetical protein